LVFFISFQPSPLRAESFFYLLPSSTWAKGYQEIRKGNYCLLREDGHLSIEESLVPGPHASLQLGAFSLFTTP
jgi:hypothetical protein